MTDRFTLADALGWTIFVTLGLWWSAVMAGALSGSDGAHDIVTAVGVEAIVILGACALFAARRPGQSWSELFAMRRATLPVHVVALLLGAALCPPANRLSEAIQTVYPPPPELLEHQRQIMQVHTPLRGVLVMLAAAGAGPLVEELFFRGALFTALKRHATTLVTVSTTALLFTTFHPIPSVWAPILPLALVLGWVRARTGSLFPAVLAHSGFNATTLAMGYLLPDATVRPLPLVLGGLAASAVLLGALWLLGNGASAKHARELDGGLPS